MCTGDNILTGVSVARECGIIDASSPCFVPRFVEGKKMGAHVVFQTKSPNSLSGNMFDPNARLSWENTENSDCLLDENTLTVCLPSLSLPRRLIVLTKHQPIPTRGGTDLSVPYRNPNYSIAVTGDIFRWIVDYGSTEVLNKVCSHAFFR